MPDVVSTVSTPLIVDGDAMKRMEEVEYLLEFIERSDRYRQMFVPIWDEVLANYLVTPYGSAGAGLMWTRSGEARVPYRNTGKRKRVRSVLKDPETHQVIETVTAQAIGLLLGGRDYITAVPLGVDDYEKARLLARLIQAVMESPGVWRTHYQLFKDAFLFGTAILKIGWETRARKQFVRGRGGKLKPEDVVYRDRPLQRIVDHYNFYPDPTGTRINEDMVGVAERFQITFREALRLSEPGPNGEPPVYDKAMVDLAIRNRLHQNEKAKKGGYNRKDERFPNLPKELPRSMEMLDGFDYYGESPVPRSDGMSNRVMTLLNGINVRSRGNQFIDGEKPYVEVAVNPISGRFYGLGVGEVVRFLQDSTDHLLMTMTDASNLAVNSPLLVGGGFGGNPQELQERAPNSLIHVNDVKQVEPVPVDIGVLDFAMRELGRRKMSMREASGATNPLQSIPTSDRATATEVSELVRLASQRVEHMVLLIERDAYPRIGRMIHARLRQFLPEGGAVATMAGEPFEVPLEAVDIEADIRFTGSRQAGSRFQKAATYRTMAETLGTDAGMQLALLYPEVLVRWFRDGAEITDAEEIIGKATERALAMEKLQVAEGASSAGAGGRGGSPPNPNDEEAFGTESGETEREGEALA
jgi:hypothetical protein